MISKSTPVSDALSRRHIVVAALFCLACSSAPPVESDPPLPVDSSEEECVNSIPADPMPEPVDAFGEEPPSREDSLPTLLSETGLYTDIATKSIDPVVLGFTPQFQLWSDGAEKSRWVYLPECDTIDSADMDDWRLPVGTRLWKEFAVDGARIETRLIERIGTGARDFVYVSYQWNAAETEAERVPPEGVADANGTDWDIPSHTECLQCHGEYALGGGRPSRALGFSALQLSHKDTALTLDQLVEADELSDAPKVELTVPGGETAQQALGYLHANCGNCHNSTEDGLPHVDLDLWIQAGTSAVEAAAAWQTAVDQPAVLFNDQHVSGRIVPGDPDASAVLYRMGQRGNTAQMPPVATATVDTEGVAAVRAWIESL